VVAPVKIGKRRNIGSGSVDHPRRPDDALAVEAAARRRRATAGRRDYREPAHE